MKQLLIAVLVAATAFTACKKDKKDDNGNGGGGTTQTTAEKMEGTWKLTKINDSIPEMMQFLEMKITFKEDKAKKGTGTAVGITKMTIPGFPESSDTSYSTYEVISSTQVKTKDEDGEETTVTIVELTKTKLVINGIKDDNDQDQKMEFEKSN